MANAVLSQTVADLVARPPAPRRHHHLAATPETCYWGHIDAATPPVLTVEPGDEITIETVTHHAGDAPDLMMDEGIRSVWDGIPLADRGPGPHLLTGPIHVEGAEPGDTLVVQIDRLAPRLGFGANFAARTGLLHGRAGIERMTIYEMTGESEGRSVAVPRFGFDLPDMRVYEEGPGFVVDPGTVDRQEFSAPVSIRVRPHFGVLGVAPNTSERLSTAPPGTFGGNVDDWRFGPGATICYPVYVSGALLYAGDPHFAQGDGEITGTAIEASLTGTIRVFVARDVGVRAPLLETPTSWITHGFGADLNEAMAMAADEAVWLMTTRFGLTANDAYSLCAVGVDFGVTQVVNGVVGCHGIVDKQMFE